MQETEISQITNYIFLESKPQKADLAIIFGTRYNGALDKVFELYKNNLVNKVVVSGGINRVTGENEADRMLKILVDKGVKEKDIIKENKSTNSLENVLFSKQLIESEIGFANIKKIIAIVKHYHSRRVLMTLKKHFPKNVELIPVTYDIYGFTKDDWYNSEIGRRKVLSEWEKISKYLTQGDIEEL